MCRETWDAQCSKNKVYKFPNMNVKAFSIYQEWMYSQQICIEDDEGGDDSKIDLNSLIMAYLLGARIGNKKFCSAVLEATLESFDECGLIPGPWSLGLAYEATKPESPLRPFLVHVWLK